METVIDDKFSADVYNWRH